MGFVRLTALLVVFLGASPSHPRILATDADRDAVINKIATVDWARKTWDSMRTTVDPYVTRHMEDPEWILSRLQMHWKSGLHATNTWIDSTGLVTNFRGDAAYPTVRVGNKRSGSNADGVLYVTPPLDKVPPYREDGRLFMNIGSGTDYEWNEPGAIRGTVNAKIISLALTSSFMYWVTRQEKYARFAADILCVLAEGIAPLVHVNGGNQMGLVTAQTIDDSTSYAASLPVVYDFLYDWLAANHGRFSTRLVPVSGPALTYPIGTNAAIPAMIVRFLSNFVNFGVTGNNWNAVESVALVYGALALDGKADRDRVMAYFLSNSSAPNFDSIGEMVSNNFNEDMIWNEPPGYNNYPLMYLIPACAAADRNGYSVFAKFPKLATAAIGLENVQFPNGLYPSYGDTHFRAAYSTPTIELSLATAVRLSNFSAVDRAARILRGLQATGYSRTGGADLSGVTHLVSSLAQVPAPSGDDGPDVTSGVDYASFYAQRNGNDARFGMMATVFTGGGSNGIYAHSHSKNFGMELFGRGQVFGLDSGSAETYEMRANWEYYSRFAAANGVVVNGNSQPLNKNRGLSTGAGSYYMNKPSLNAIEPALGKAPVSENHSFVDLSLQDGTNGVPGTAANITNTPHVAAQRRVVALVRTSSTTGFYVDVFRSKWLSGDATMPGNTDTSEKFHDYLFHGLGWNGGRSIGFAGARGEELWVSASTVPETNGVTPGWRGPGYAWFSEREAIASDKAQGTVRARFDFAPIHFDAWVVGGEGRTVVRASTPVSALSPETLKSAQTMDGAAPCLVVRQEGEAWMRPFVAVYEAGDYGNSSVAKVRRFAGISASNDFTGIAVESKPLVEELRGRIDRIFCATNFASNQVSSEEGFAFRGSFAVWSENADGFQSAYLGNGNRLEKLGSHGIRIEAAAPGAASLVRTGASFRYTSTASVTITLRAVAPVETLFTDLSQYTSSNGILVEGASVTTLADGAGRGGVVSALFPAATNGLLFVGPKGRGGVRIQNAVSLSLNGNAVVLPRLRIAPGDRLDATVSDSFGVRPETLVLKKNGSEFRKGMALSPRVQSEKSFTVTLGGGDLEAASYSFVATNDLGSEIRRTFEVESTARSGEVTCFPNPFVPGKSRMRLSFRTDADKDGMNVRITTLGGALVEEIRNVPRGSGGTTSVDWAGLAATGRPLPAGIYLARLEWRKGGVTQTSTGRLIVGTEGR